MGGIIQTVTTMPTREVWKCLLAELCGTFILLFVGCGSALYRKGEVAPSLEEAALCWGLMIATLIQIFGHTSGCHLNPAATIAHLVTGKIELVKSVLYIITQCVGAIIGVAALQGFTPSKMKGDFAVLSVASDLTPFQGCLVEFIISFIFLFLVFAVSDENRTDVDGSPALAVGLTVTILILGAGHHTGAGLNPARVFGPAVMVGHWSHHWVYWVGCTLGSAAGGLVYHHIFSLPPKPISIPKIIQNIEMTNMSRRGDSFDDIHGQKDRLKTSQLEASLE